MLRRYSFTLPSSSAVRWEQGCNPHVCVQAQPSAEPSQAFSSRVFRYLCFPYAESTCSRTLHPRPLPLRTRRKPGVPLEDLPEEHRILISNRIADLLHAAMSNASARRVWCFYMPAIQDFAGSENYAEFFLPNKVACLPLYGGRHSHLRHHSPGERSAPRPPRLTAMPSLRASPAAYSSAPHPSPAGSTSHLPAAAPR